LHRAVRRRDLWIGQADFSRLSLERESWPAPAALFPTRRVLQAVCESIAYIGSPRLRLWKFQFRLLAVPRWRWPRLASSPPTTRSLPPQPRAVSAPRNGILRGGELKHFRPCV